ncbi:MAG: helix-turn-helix domain-containing protein, partial [Bacteroidales bacterium]|nr:helix-turn-helix domain-containing protein [Bacteroidales bacterium]
RNKNYTPASYNLIQLGRIAAHIESDTSYFEYYHMANDLAIKSGDTARLSNNLVNMGIAYKNAGYPYLGLKYLKEAEKYYYHQRLYGRTHLLLALSEAYYGVDSVSKAITISKRARQDALKINVFDLIYHVNLKLVKYYKSLNEIDSSRRYMLLAIKDSKSLDHRISFQHLYKQISDMSLQMNDYPNAMAYLDSSYLEYEKFLSKTNNDKLVQLREKSDYYLHRNKISQLVSDNVLEQEKSMKLKIVIFAVLFVLVLTVYFTFIVRKRLKQLKESYVTLVKKSIEQDKLNKQLRECEVKHKKKVKHENISGEDLIIKNFKKLLYQEEIFTDTHLSLKSLADNLNTNTSYLSAIINSHFNCNLRTLINKHRIDKAREMLVSKEFDHYSMEGISSEVGFSSRSGFYQAFKAATGLSPSLYIENYQLVISSK